MSQIQTGRYSDLLRRYLGMKGVTEVAAELSPEISAVMVLELERPEWLFLKGEKICSGVFTQTPNAGLDSTARLRNPAGSGVLAIVTSLHVSIQADGILVATRDTDQGNLATVLPTVSRDTRLPELDASALIASAANSSLTGESYWSCQMLANDPILLSEPVVLTPGNQIEISTVVVNIGIRGVWSWREQRFDVLET